MKRSIERKQRHFLSRRTAMAKYLSACFATFVAIISVSGQGAENGKVDGELAAPEQGLYHFLNANKLQWLPVRNLSTIASGYSAKTSRVLTSGQRIDLEATVVGQKRKVLVLLFDPDGKYVDESELSTS